MDVHLILPHVPDKKFAYALAKTHYKSLLDSGVKISEWLPGFVHAKVFVVDDSEAVVGTINLDYRSLYHHFENAVWMKDTACIPAIEKDFQKTLEFCRDVEPHPGEHLGGQRAAPSGRNFTESYCTITVNQRGMPNGIPLWFTNNPYPSRSPGR